MINDYVAKKILLLVFPFLKDDDTRITKITDYTGMFRGKINSYNAEYESDDDLKFKVKLYTEDSPNKNEIECFVYKRVIDDDDDDLWDIDTDHSSEAKRFYDDLHSKKTFLSDKNGFCLKIANHHKENIVKCPICFTEFSDVSPEIMKNTTDTVECPICSVKLVVSREIKIVYDINLEKHD